MRVACIAGARPNFMKVKPVVDALEGGGADVVLVHTGQHYDTSMSDVFFDDLGLRRPDHDLCSGSGTHACQAAAVMMALEPLLERIQADVVVVVGDVNSTMAAALVAAKCGCLVAHVEAGLRSRDWTMPEEVNRVVVDCVSDILLATSPDAVDNLRAEGRPADAIHLVGNTMIDSLLANVERACSRPTLAGLGVAAGGYGLVTLHRPANVDDPVALGSITSALAALSNDLPLILPAHPRAAARLREAGMPASVHIVGPLGYLDFIALEASARMVLTDSGGIQEEATVLGVPCLTLRYNTERPITVTEGTNVVVGRDPDRILREAHRVLADGVEARRPALWDGKAGQRIADVLTATVTQKPWRRPTDLRR